MADVAGRAARLLADEGGEVEMRPALRAAEGEPGAERIQPDDATGVNRSLSSPKLPNRLWSPTKQTTGHGILARLHVFWYSIDKRQIRQMAME